MIYLIGTTRNKWDSVIDLPLLWEQYERIITDKGAIVLTAQTPFDKVLGCSNLSLLRYEWIWEKAKATGHLNAKKMPMKAHENILVFYKQIGTYNPQMIEGELYTPSGGASKKDNYGDFKAVRENDGKLRYPRSVQSFRHETKPIHPTQKPVELFEYLIKTYTNEGDVVLDNCAGSGTTAIAAINTNRRYICMESDPEYFDLMCQRVIDYEN